MQDISYDGGIIRQKVLMKIGNELPGLPVESQGEFNLIGHSVSDQDRLSSFAMQYLLWFQS